MTAKVLFPLGIIVLIICLLAVYFGFLKPMSEAYHFTQWQELNIEGRRALMQNRLDDAEREFGQALAEIGQSGTHKLQESETLTMAGETARLKHDYSTAEAKFQSAVSLIEQEIAVEKRKEESDVLQYKLSDALSRLAQTYDERGKKPEALASRERVLTIYTNIAKQRTIPGDNVLLAEQMVRNYGKAAEKATAEGNYAEARQIYMKIFEIGMHSYVPEDLWNIVQADCKQLIKTNPINPDPLAVEVEKEQMTPFSSQLDTEVH